MEPAIFPQASTFTGTCPPCQTGGHVSGVCVQRCGAHRGALCSHLRPHQSVPPRTAHLLRAPPTSQTCFLKNGLCVFLRCRARRLTAFAHLQGRALNNWPRLRPLLVGTMDAGDVMGDKNVSGGGERVGAAAARQQQVLSHVSGSRTTPIVSPSPLCWCVPLSLQF